MSLRVVDYRSAIEHLPDGAVLALNDVTWDEYERLLTDLADRPGTRITYDRGRLEIMTPTRKHEAYKEFFARVVYALGDELDVNVESLGSTTWKRQRDFKGTEPDACFYVANADIVLGDREVDLTVDPPPDLVVEIDVSNESLGKLPIYAGFGVPEIWRYDAGKSQLQISRLEGGSYVEVSASAAFPMLDIRRLSELIDECKRRGQRAGLQALRAWLREGER